MARLWRLFHKGDGAPYYYNYSLIAGADIELEEGCL